MIQGSRKIIFLFSLIFASFVVSQGYVLPQWSYNTSMDGEDFENGINLLLDGACTKTGRYVQSPAAFNIDQEAEVAEVGGIPCGYYNNFQLVLNDVEFSARVDDQIWNNIVFTSTESWGWLYADSIEDEELENPVNYTANTIVFHAPAENLLGSYRAPLEMQIYLQNSTTNDTEFAVLSVFFTDANTTWIQNSSSYIHGMDGLGKLGTIPYDAPGSVNFNLSQIQTIILSNINILTYAGTLTIPNCSDATWYVNVPLVYMDSEVITNFINTFDNSILNLPGFEFIQNGQTATPGNFRNATPVDKTVATRFCWTGYAQVTLPYNYGLWAAILITIVFFSVTLTLEDDPILDNEYHTEAWTHHPLYSIFQVSNNIFTAKSRASLVWINLICMCLITSILYGNTCINDCTDVKDNLDVIYFAFIGIAGSIIVTYLHGALLRLHYIYKAKAIELEDQKFEERAQFFLAMFYFLLFLWVTIGNGMFVWQMSALTSLTENTLQHYWLGTFFIAVLIDWIVIDILCVALANFPLFRNIFKWKGLIYDAEVCHYAFKTQKKTL